MSTDPTDPFILTPATLLTQKTGTSSVPPGDFGKPDLYKQQWRTLQSLATLSGIDGVNSTFLPYSIDEMATPTAKRFQRMHSPAQGLSVETERLAPGHHNGNLPQPRWASSKGTSKNHWERWTQTVSETY